MMVDNRRKVLICVMLGVVTFAAYWPALKNGFVAYDDDDYVTNNQVVKDGLTSAGIVWAFSHSHASNWHPLTWLSHMLDCTMFGLNPAGHHLVNLLLHATNAILLFLILNAMTGSFWSSAFVAALFSVHPLHVESVAWIAERKDLLSTFFGLLTIASYVRYSAKGWGDKLWYFTTLLLFLLALISKPMLVTVPFIMLLLDYWPLGRLNKVTSKSINRHHLYILIREKIPFFALSIASCIVTYIVQLKSGAVKSVDVFPLYIRIPNAFASYLRYMEKMLWPSELSLLYPFPTETFIFTAAAISIVLLTVASVLIFRAAHRHKYLLVGWLWYMGTLVPVIGLVQVGNQAMADRYTYLPSIGFFIIIAWLAADLLSRYRIGKFVPAACAVTVIIVLSLCTRAQVAYWKDSIALFKRAVSVTDNNYIMHYNLGIALRTANRMDEAIEHYQQAAQIRPDIADMQNSLADALQLKGRFDEAAYHHMQALQIDPNDSLTCNNLGIILIKQNKLTQAVDYFRRAIKIKSNYPEAYNNLANALTSLGRLEEAVSCYQQAVTLKPDYTKAHENMGVALKKLGRSAQALEHLRRALSLEPDRPVSLNAAAQILAVCPDPNIRDTRAAVEMAQRAARVTGRKDAGILSTLAGCCAASYQFDAAFSNAEEALSVARKNGNTKLAEEIRKQAENYRQLQAKQ